MTNKKTPIFSPKIYNFDFDLITKRFLIRKTQIATTLLCTRGAIYLAFWQKIGVIRRK
jgi:hypothetical protein